MSFQDEALTDAENRVAVAVSRGLSNKEIAARTRDQCANSGEPHQSHPRQKRF